MNICTIIYIMLNRFLLFPPNQFDKKNLKKIKQIITRCKKATFAQIK